MLEDGEVTPTEYGIVHYLAEAGADRSDGTATTYEQLARLFHVTPKTVARALAKLAAGELLRYDLRQGQRRPFRVHGGPRLRTLPAPPVSEVVSEVTMDSHVASGASKPASELPSVPNPTSDNKPTSLDDTETRDKNNATELVRLAIAAYQEAGGSLELAEWRGALARQANSLRKAGVAVRAVLAAAAQLGQERAFPGYLSQRAKALVAAGGPCSWDGLDRSRLKAEQLAACPCRRCAEWQAFMLEESRA
jgi:hypothetical protein